MSDSKVTIEVQLNTKTFEKQIKQTEQELVSMEKKLEFLAKVNERRANSEDKVFKISTEEYKVMQKLGLTMEDIVNKDTFGKLEQDIEKSRNKLIDLNAKQDELNNKNNSTAVDTFKNIENATENIIKKVGKWALAIFSVRSAYMLVRQAVSTISQYNEQIGTDIQYIRFVLATTLQPIIEGIIKLVYKLLAYINYIAKAWFGVNLFANASAKAFQKANKGVKDTNKSAKQLQKTLTGFDEMNILQDTGDTTTGGGGGGVPSYDLSKNLQKVEIPKWLETLTEHGEEIITIITGIAQAFMLWKVGQWLNNLGLFAQGFSTLSKTLQGIGVVMILIGVYNAVEDIVNLIRNPSWENFIHLIGDLGVALAGLGVILLSFNLSNPFGWIAIGVGLVAKLIDAIGLSTDANNDEEKSILSVYDAEQKLNDAREKRVSASKSYADAVKEEEKTLDKLNKLQKDNKVSGEQLHEEILIGKKNYKDLLPKEREVYDAYLDHLQAVEKLDSATEELNNTIKKEKEVREQKIGAVYEEQGVMDDYFNTLIDGYRKSEISADEMGTAMIKAMDEMSEETRTVFINSLPDDIRETFKSAVSSTANFMDNMLGTTEGEVYQFKDGVIWSFDQMADSTTEFKTTFAGIKDIFSETKKTVENPMSMKLNVKVEQSEYKKFIEKLGKTTLLGGLIKLKTPMAKGGIIKLASGAVINQPGRGVPLSSNVRGGEAGREGILPLTDSQAMQQLGYEIGRYITVNAQMNNYMNGRLISKELQTVQNQQDFAFNR